MSAGHNPTGITYSFDRRRYIGQQCAAADIPIIDDATLGELLDPESLGMAAAGTEAEVLTVSSLSKSVWPGLRVGWVPSSRDLIEHLARLKAVADLGSSLLSQALAARLVPQLSEVSLRRRRTHAHRLGVLRDLLAAEMPTWSWSADRRGPFLWVRIPHGNASVFSQLAMRHGVRVVAGGSMATDRSQDAQLRISCTADEDTLRTAVERLKCAWDDYLTSAAAEMPVEIVI